MKSIGLVLKLRPGCYEEYKKRHDELWPELSVVMKSVGVSMVIYRHEDLLFVHERFPSQQACDQLSAHPVTARWNLSMGEVLEADDRGAAIATVIPLAFSFGEFKS